MKIALLCPASLPATQFGGILFLTVNLAKEFVKLGNEVTIFTTDLDSANNLHTFNKKLPRIETVNGFKINRTHCWLSIYLFYINPGMCKQLKNFNADVIHTIGLRSFQSLIAAYVSKKKKIPLVVSDQGGLFTHPELNNASTVKKILFRLQYVAIRYIVRQASSIIVGNQYEKDMFARLNVESKITIVKNGIDMDELKTEAGSFREKYGIGDRFFLFVGRFHESKGIDILLKAVNSVKNQPQMDDTTLVLMGIDDGFGAKMTQMIKELSLEKSVLVINKPPRKDVILAYQDCEFTVLPSRWELSPLMPLEGFAFKKASIGTNTHGTPHTIIDGKTGVLVEPENHSELGAAILDLLGNEQKRTSLGLGGYQMVKDVCNSKQMMNSILKEYEKLLS
jgi:glycosyltransferase involved in cell wall biosynthesis